MSSPNTATTPRKRSSLAARGVGGLIVAVAMAVGALAAPTIASAHPKHGYGHHHHHGDHRRYDRRGRYDDRHYDRRHKRHYDHGRYERRKWREFRRDLRAERRWERRERRAERHWDRLERRLDRRERRAERRWRLGYKLPRHVRYYEIHDYHRYRLGPPPRGHFYANVDRDVVLIARATLGVVTFLGAIDALSRH